MFCDIRHVFALLTFLTVTTSLQLWPQGRGNSEAGNKGSAGRPFQFDDLCSKAGNCTCLFERYHVTVKCTSAGDKLGEIASELPQSTTHL